MALDSYKGLGKDQMQAVETELSDNQDTLGLAHVDIGRTQGTWDHPAAFIFIGPGDVRILQENEDVGVNLWAVPVAITTAVLDFEGAVDDDAMDLAEKVADHVDGQALGNAHKTKPTGFSVGGPRTKGNGWETIAAAHIQFHVKVNAR